jgi:Domain of unknown function (DUF1816)
MSCPIDPNYVALRFSWWIEVFTAHPSCIYYFGPFDSQREADLAQDGYLEDLRSEGAHIVSVRSQLCQPRKLTIYENELTIHDLEFSPLTFFEGLVIR